MPGWLGRKQACAPAYLVPGIFIIILLYYNERREREFFPLVSLSHIQEHEDTVYFVTPSSLLCLYFLPYSNYLNPLVDQVQK